MKNCIAVFMSRGITTYVTMFYAEGENLQNYYIIVIILIIEVYT